MCEECFNLSMVLCRTKLVMSTSFQIVLFLLLTKYDLRNCLIHLYEVRHGKKSVNHLISWLRGWKWCGICKCLKVLKEQGIREKLYTEKDSLWLNVEMYKLETYFYCMCISSPFLFSSMILHLLFQWIVGCIIYRILVHVWLSQ